MLRWPDRATVDRAVRAWAQAAAQARPDLLAAAYYGSYARGDWGVGSDVDLLAVESDDTPRVQRAARWDTTSLPVYTRAEWEAADRTSRFFETLRREASWVYLREGFRPYG